MCFSWQLLHTWQSLIKDPAQGNSVNIIFLYGGNSCISVEILIDNVKCLSLQLSIYSFIEGQLQEIVRKSRYCTAVHEKALSPRKQILAGMLSASQYVDKSERNLMAL